VHHVGILNDGFFCLRSIVQVSVHVTPKGHVLCQVGVTLYLLLSVLLRVKPG